jgi:hypothetical protein
VIETCDQLIHALTLYIARTITILSLIVADEPQIETCLTAKARISLPFGQIFDEMSTSFSINWFGSLGRQVSTRGLAECSEKS